MKADLDHSTTISSMMYNNILRGLVLAGVAISFSAESLTPRADPVSTIPPILPTRTVSTTIDGQIYAYDIWTTTVPSYGAIAESTTDVNDDTATIIYPIKRDYGPEDTVLNVIFNPR
jgi:hypothetical protein